MYTRDWGRLPDDRKEMFRQYLWKLYEMNAQVSGPEQEVPETTEPAGSTTGVYGGGSPEMNQATMAQADVGADPYAEAGMSPFSAPAGA